RRTLRSPGLTENPLMQFGARQSPLTTSGPPCGNGLCPGASCSVHQNYDSADTGSFCTTSPFWYITERAHALPPTSDLEMQLHPVGAGIAHLRDRLSCTYLFPLFHQQAAVMGIGTEIGLIVLDDDHVPITEQSTTRVNYCSVSRSFYRLTQLTGNINPFIQTAVRLESGDDLALRRPLPAGH